MSFDSVPIWAVLLATIGLVFLSIETGVRLGKRRLLRGGGKLEVSGAMIGATMALLAFMLAFTFNGAAGRHDARKTLVIEEANAIEMTWLRAGFLAEPNRADSRGLLRDYVDLRVKAAGGQVDLMEAVLRSEALHDKMWAVALEVGQKNASSITAGLFIQSLNQVIDLHLKLSTPLGSSRCGDLSRRLHGRSSEDSVRASGGEMALNVEGVVGSRVKRQEPLG